MQLQSAEFFPPKSQAQSNQKPLQNSTCLPDPLPALLHLLPAPCHKTCFPRRQSRPAKRRAPLLIPSRLSCLCRTSGLFTTASADSAPPPLKLFYQRKPTGEFPPSAPKPRRPPRLYVRAHQIKSRLYFNPVVVDILCKRESNVDDPAGCRRNGRETAPRRYMYLFQRKLRFNHQFHYRH